jgi:ABC-type phosphate/phosphonate transport system substrate-binding protein
MTARKLHRKLLFLAVCISAWCSKAWGDDDKRSEPVRIGIVSTLFRNTPEPLVSAMMQPFAALMESQTGVAGQLIPGGNALHLGQLLAEDQVQLGVFHGLEFAWARQKYPKIQPLMLAVNQNRHLRTLVVARAACEATCFADFQGKPVAFPRHSREHCRIFLQVHCDHCRHEAAQLFAPFTTPANTEDALDDVVEKAVDAAVVDAVALECYKRRKPGRYASLRVIEQSVVFPAAVVAYVPGNLDEETVRAFHDGLINANKTALGRQFITLWKLTAFEPVPQDYEPLLQSILRSYPQPVSSNLK